MSTLDNLNENIINKIGCIDKINYIIVNDLKIPFTSKDGIHFDYMHLHKIPFSFFKNLNILNKRYNIFLETKNLYEMKSIYYLTNYYNLSSINYLQLQNTIYNDNIFLLSTNSQILNNDDLLLLKYIYYNNYYKYKVYSDHYFSQQKLLIHNKNKHSKYFNQQQSNKLTKNIYYEFNIFLSSEDIYGILDSYLDFINHFLIKYKDDLDLLKIISRINNVSIIEKAIKKLFYIINQYKKTKFIYSIDDIEYDLCKCGNKMIIQSNTSELLCTNCGYIHTLVGSVFENSQFYQQEGNRFAHGSYDPNRHCKFWIERIQAKENTIIDEESINKIKLCIKKDKVENLKNISIEQFRLYLKQTKLSKLNDHIPLIKKLITGYIPPQLNHKELQLLFNYFDKATKIYNQIKPKEKSNSLYYPFLIWKILDLIIDDKQKKKELLSCIHLQSYETLIDNDKIWYQICKHNDKFIYKPTDKSILY